MAFNVSALSDYTEQNADQLVIKSLFGARTQEIIAAEGTIQTGIKSSETVNILDTDATFQTGGTCGFLSSGSTSFSQRTITVGKIKVNESLCPKALEAKYTQKALQIGSRYEKIPFEQQYTDLKAGTIAEQMETAIWQGDTASANANLNKFDGFIKLIDNSLAAVAANTGGITTGTGITESNVRTIVKNMYLNLPRRVAGKKDVRIFCGWDTFNKFIAAYTDANLFNFAPKGTEVSAENGEVIIPGTFYRLTAVHGLDETNRLFAMRTTNMYFGTDLENEEERWEIFFAKEADEIRFVAEWKAGVQVAFPNEIVQFKLV